MKELLGMNALTGNKVWINEIFEERMNDIAQIITFI